MIQSLIEFNYQNFNLGKGVDLQLWYNYFLNKISTNKNCEHGSLFISKLVG